MALADIECGWNGGYAIYCPISAPVCCTDHCCPTNSPVCCNDGQSCCWNGTICDPAHKRCLVVDDGGFSPSRVNRTTQTITPITITLPYTTIRIHRTRKTTKTSSTASFTRPYTLTPTIQTTIIAHHPIKRTKTTILLSTNTPITDNSTNISETTISPNLTTSKSTNDESSNHETSTSILEQTSRTTTTLKPTTIPTTSSTMMTTPKLTTRPTTFSTTTTTTPKPTTKSTTTTTKTTTISTTTKPAIACPIGWYLFTQTNKCYYSNGPFIMSGLGWKSAQEYCQQNGGQLATLHSQAEYDMAYQVWMKLIIRFDGPWIGLYRKSGTSPWEWIDGTPVDFTKWLPQNPVNDMNKNCVWMNYNLGWKNDYCDGNMQYICERKAYLP
uniref:C-type lectin domain-containing protein n=1 Tax=Acrobeloides nanus TaxID=290746 RepID=A0A914D3E2_9BILA